MTNLFKRHLMAASFLLLLAGCGSNTGTSTVTSSTSGTTTPTTTTTSPIPSLQAYSNSFGAAATYIQAGEIDTNSAFFQALGTNGRTCASCHQLSQGLSITPSYIQSLFTSTQGTDPLFAAIDGANCPTAPGGNSTARSLLLNNGLIRVSVALPKTAQFTISATSDPYGCAISTNSAGQQVVSVYRRPLPPTGLNYLTEIMWDTRETLSPLTTDATLAACLGTDLNQQMLDAITNHEQGTSSPTTAQLSAMLTLEEALYTAQSSDTLAGALNSNGATGGPQNFASVLYYPGINDAFGGDPKGKTFNPAVFNLYTAWRNSATNAQQASIERGENIFNTAPLQIVNVSGINDNTALGSPNNLRGSCSTCHDTPNVGNHSLPLPMDTGTSRLAASETDPGTIAGLNTLSAPSLPVYQITGCKDVNGRAVTYTTSDPSKGLFTGQCADINRTTVPSLRGLAARAPYFHGGSAPDLATLVRFYNARFNMRLNAAQQQDLVNFLAAL